MTRGKNIIVETANSTGECILELVSYGIERNEGLIEQKEQRKITSERETPTNL